MVRDHNLRRSFCYKVISLLTLSYYLTSTGDLSIISSSDFCLRKERQFQIAKLTLPQVEKSDSC